jgi:hypothetical protein
MDDLHVLAITRLPSAVTSTDYRSAPEPQGQLSPQDALWLASLLGLSAYDARMRLAGPAPWFAARLPAPEAAAQIAALRDRGFGAVGVGLGASAPRLVPSSVVIQPGEEGLEDTSGRPLFAYEAVRLIVVATLDQEHGAERVEEVIVGGRFSRGGPTTVEVSRYQYERQQRRALYVFLEAGPPALCFTQSSLAAPSIPARTSRERIDGLLRLLRERCPRALVDERLAQAPRKRTSFLTLPPTTSGRDAVSSNANETDLATCALALALAQDQLG